MYENSSQHPLFLAVQWLKTYWTLRKWTLQHRLLGLNSKLLDSSTLGHPSTSTPDRVYLRWRGQIADCGALVLKCLRVFRAVCAGENDVPFWSAIIRICTCCTSKQITFFRIQSRPGENRFKKKKNEFWNLTFWPVLDLTLGRIWKMIVIIVLFVPNDP